MSFSLIPKRLKAIHYERVGYMTGYIINAIMLLATAWLISRIPLCKNNCGTLDIGTLLDSRELTVKRRKLKIGNTVFHVTSVFTGKVRLDEALQNIALKRQKDGNLPSLDNKRATRAQEQG